jgi:hypothetical protein
LAITSNQSPGVDVAREKKSNADLVKLFDGVSVMRMMIAAHPTIQPVATRRAGASATITWGSIR